MIIGFNFTSVAAHVNEDQLTGGLDVNSVPSIDDVSEKKLAFLGENKVISVKFSFKTSYGKAGEIVQKGEILYQVDDAKKHVKSWSSIKKLDEDVSLNCLNFLLNKCMSKAVDYADMLRLPPPLQFPFIEKKQHDAAQPKIVEIPKKSKVNS